MKISKEDKALIRAYVKWAINKGFYPVEYEVSNLIGNKNSEHRYLVEDYINKLKQGKEV